ncbi:Zinc-specific metallo-regulatory protein [Caprobacter fermentans]|uniref:Transcriptional repressor n=1 Tax=Caproicibacter fermentans TaxID=2576756 RepID=A0A6N8HUM1_9FIRM|nr:Fur family transcriptional regulator [Caproicibacter fermentans]MVB09389.1 Zinc-specific metallo-regulatory protein [Caproicibacter fermentans]OCN02775.1 hypothetical protein A7X67_02660 [Clostridium sp. W14A]QNK40487.1 transcriptional repressor [Caproicibacter fermentans]
MPNQTEIEKLLKNRNIKRTRTRILVLEILKDSSPKTVDEIFSALYQNNAKLSLSTVYRTCETLTGKGILLKMNLTDDGVARYEYMKSEHTHHAICLGCNKIMPIDDCPYGQFDLIMKSKYGFNVKSHHIEIYGYCKECSQKDEKK